MIPHRFRAILTALALENQKIPKKKRRFKKYARYRPWQFAWVLKNALMGKDIPAFQLQAAFKYRTVSFYRDRSLVCQGNADYLALVQGMAQVFVAMGYKGWVVLFDEGEAIVQAGILGRARSYALLQALFFPDRNGRAGALYPVFAFTHVFFSFVAQEDFSRIRTVRNRTAPYFPMDYHRSWQSLPIHYLRDLGPGAWQELIRGLIQAHARAYGWHPEKEQMINQMTQALARHQSVETRLKLKYLVTCLDLALQDQMLSPVSR
jgi:hypothetical protein